MCVCVLGGILEEMHHILGIGKVNVPRAADVRDSELKLKAKRNDTGAWITDVMIKVLGVSLIQRLIAAQLLSSSLSSLSSNKARYRFLKS